MWLITIKRCLILGYLGYHAYHDIKSQRLYLNTLIGGGLLVTAITLLIGLRQAPVWQLRRTASGIVVFIAFLLISRYTEEKIGYADSLIIGFLALALGALDVILMVIISCLFIALWCVITKRKEAPYLPFLLASYLLVMF
ncbi:leader peptidase (prepilin peptidase)/N-methyltransferase [Lachnospiraceae bacterium PF1-21]|uniref:prepilin peptidase n=1 Tax=Ohessyouella blattaphilus TaxID=2949333 RepID=UPI00256A11E6|nr:prepilin peptidase [Lachnospiraceae bacterium OttesenSCG-928-J05]